MLQYKRSKIGDIKDSEKVTSIHSKMRIKSGYKQEKGCLTVFSCNTAIKYAKSHNSYALALCSHSKAMLDRQIIKLSTNAQVSNLLSNFFRDFLEILYKNNKYSSLEAMKKGKRYAKQVYCASMVDITSIGRLFVPLSSIAFTFLDKFSKLKYSEQQIIEKFNLNSAWLIENYLKHIKDYSAFEHKGFSLYSPFLPSLKLASTSAIKRHQVTNCGCQNMQEYQAVIQYIDFFDVIDNTMIPSENQLASEFLSEYIKHPFIRSQSLDLIHKVEGISVNALKRRANVDSDLSYEELVKGNLERKPAAKTNAYEKSKLIKRFTKDDKETINNLIEVSFLTKDELTIIQNRLFYDKKPLSLRDLAQFMGYSREWIRVLENEAFDKILLAIERFPDLKVEKLG